MNTNNEHMYNNKSLRLLFIPIIIEQLLNSLMGTVDSIMVSNIGSAAISAVSLVDAINILVTQAFAALAAGGTIICSQYIGSKNKKEANKAAKQLILVVSVIGIIVMALMLTVRFPLLKLIFGKVSEDVMKASQTYFFYTVISYPFIGLFNAGSSIFRAQGNSRTPMIISVVSNLLNVAGNFILIWGAGLGVAGAAISTLLSRIFCMVVVIIMLRNHKNEIVINEYLRLKPDKRLIMKILIIGIPSGIENSMFQFGKLAIQSTVSAMGTVAIAAQAMTNILENLNGIAGIGIGIGMMTVVGECIGANKKDEAIYYIKKLTAVAEVVIIASCAIVFLLAKPITIIGGMEEESAKLCMGMMVAITLVKPVVWVGSFVPAYGMRAAGDVKFSMIVSCITMWMFRVTLCVFLANRYNMGPMAVWYGMFTDWTVRTILFTIRFKSRKWLNHKVIE